MPNASAFAKARARSIAHRWGPAVAVSPTIMWALGVRYDEEDDAAAETFLVRLGPGKAEIVDQLPGVARAFCAAGETTWLLDERGTLHVAGKRHKLSSPRAMTVVPSATSPHVVVAGDDRLWLVDALGQSVTPGPMWRARRLASARARIVAALDDGSVVAGPAVDSLAPVELDVRSPVGALAIDDDGRIAACSGRTLFLGDTRRLEPVANVPFEIHAIALFQGRLYFSSRAHGLFAVDDKRAVPVRPSLRAHDLGVGAGLLVCASDLYIAYADADLDWMTRDLAPFMRLTDTRMPRFFLVEGAI